MCAGVCGFVCVCVCAHTQVCAGVCAVCANAPGGFAVLITPPHFIYHCTPLHHHYINITSHYITLHHHYIDHYITKQKNIYYAYLKPPHTWRLTAGGESGYIGPSLLNVLMEIVEGLSEDMTLKLMERGGRDTVGTLRLLDLLTAVVQTH